MTVKLNAVSAEFDYDRLHRGTGRWRPAWFVATAPHGTSVCVGNSYRIYRLDRVRHVVEVEWIEAASDRDAVAAARAITNSGRSEIWLGERLVATIDVETIAQRSAAYWL